MLTQPRAIIEQLPVRDGDTIIDCGAGIGAYALALGQMTGKHGHVYAYDIQSDLIHVLAKDAEEAELHQVIGLTVDLEKDTLPLNGGSVDGALIANTLFQIGDKRHCISEVARVLKPGAWLAVIEWRDSFQGIGPHLDYIVPEEQVHALCDDVGLLYSNAIQVGSFQYGALFHKL